MCDDDKLHSVWDNQNYSTDLELARLSPSFRGPGGNVPSEGRELLELLQEYTGLIEGKSMMSIVKGEIVKNASDAATRISGRNGSELNLHSLLLNLVEHASLGYPSTQKVNNNDSIAYKEVLDMRLVEVVLFAPEQVQPQ